MSAASPSSASRASTHLELGDGRRLALRPVEPSDRERLAALFAALSSESLHRRFLGPKGALSTAELRYLTELDHVRHSAVAAVDGGGTIVAEGRYAAWSDCERKADLALVVADELQGHRIGSALGHAMVQRARDNGIAMLTASTLLENLRARAILRRLGFRPVGESHGVMDLELELAPLPC